jgi:hypothetical protein
MLTIPEPCHEDFSKMTPTERGAFCSKCQIDTFDFRDLSNMEINQILLKHKNDHLCGQFTNAQLNSLNKEFEIWKNQQTKTFRSKFMLALLLVFGLSLFSCEEEESKVILGLQSIALSQSPTTKNYVNDEVEETLDLFDYVNEVESEVVDTPLETCEEKTIEVVGTESIIEDDRMMQTAGIPAYMEGINGGMSVNVNYLNYLEAVVDTGAEESILPDPVEIDPILFEAKAFPNPTRDRATLELEIHEEGQFDIQLFNFSGQMLEAVHSGELLSGRQRFDLELSHLPSGTYLVRVISGSQVETIKVERMN